MFIRTITGETQLQTDCREQEERQTKLADRLVTLIVNVSREDFPDITSDITITYNIAATQQAWGVFLKNVCDALKVEFIHTILDRSDRSPVFRILQLRQRGAYLVRQRESSSVLEILNTGKDPQEISWSISAVINEAKKDLAFDNKNVSIVESRIKNLVSKPLTKLPERQVIDKILQSKSPLEIVHLLELFEEDFDRDNDRDYFQNQNKHYKKKDKSLDYAKFDHKVDIVTVYRIAIESLNRLSVVLNHEKLVEMAKRCFPFIATSLVRFRVEVDIIVTCLKLINDLVRFLSKKREEIFHLVLDCIQYYAPDPLPGRERKPIRSQNKNDNIMENLAKLEQMTNEAATTNESIVVNGIPINDVSSIGSVEQMQRYGYFYDSTNVFPTDTQAKIFNELQNDLTRNARKYAKTDFKLLLKRSSIHQVVWSDDEKDEEDEEQESSKHKSSEVKLEVEQANLAASKDREENIEKNKNHDNIPPPTKNVIINSRIRFSHTTASNALSSAYVTSAVCVPGMRNIDNILSKSTSPSCSPGPPRDRKVMLLTPTRTQRKRLNSQETVEESVSENETHNESQSIPLANNNEIVDSPKPSKKPPRFRIKEKIKEEDETALNVKKEWKGSSGEIGR